MSHKQKHSLFVIRENAFPMSLPITNPLVETLSASLRELAARQGCVGSMIGLVSFSLETTYWDDGGMVESSVGKQVYECDH